VQSEELADIKMILGSINQYLQNMSSQSLYIDRMSYMLDRMASDTHNLVEAIRTLVEVQYHLLAQHQKEMPEISVLPWQSPNFKNGWAERMETSATGERLESKSY